MGQKISMYQKTATISVREIALHNQVRSSFKTFLNQMLDVLRSADKMTKIILTTDFKRDLNWFLNFIPKFNGIAFIDHNPITEKIELDASLQGLGAKWGRQV